MFRELERGQRVFTGLIGWGGAGMSNLEVNGVLSENHVLTVTGTYYSELGVAPLLGRSLNPEYANPGSGSTSHVSFFFQAEDGIRYSSVTGVQTCAIPIYAVFC